MVSIYEDEFGTHWEIWALGEVVAFGMSPTRAAAIQAAMLYLIGVEEQDREVMDLYRTVEKDYAGWA